MDNQAHINQQADQSTNVTQIGYASLVSIYQSDADAVGAYLRSITEGPYGSESRELRRRYIDLAGEAAFQRQDIWDAPIIPVSFTFGGTDEQPGQEVDSVKEVVMREKRLALLGDPGAGKSTTLKVMLLDAAEACLEDATQHPLPVYLRLGAWPEGIPALHDWIERFHRAQRIEKYPIGRNVLLLLDGLNEMAGQDREDRVKSIREFVNEYPDSRCIITCRDRDYTEVWDGILRFPRLSTQPLDDDRIWRFLHKYISDTAKADELWKQIQPFDPEREQSRLRALVELARNPFMLAILAMVYERQKQLPKNNMQLFDSLVAMRWNYEAGERERPVAPDNCKVTRGSYNFTFAEFIRAMGNLAFEMTESDMGTSVHLNWVNKKFVANMNAQATGILLEIGEACGVLSLSENVGFFHQLLQEYFAAKALEWRGNVYALSEAWWWTSTLFIYSRTSSEARDKVIDACIRVLGDNNPYMRVRGSRILGWIGDSTVTPLSTAIRNRDENVRRFSAIALGRTNSENAISPLVFALRDTSGVVRTAAMRSLLRIGAPAVGPLVHALNDESVRERAARLLVRMGSESVQPCVAALESSSTDVQRMVIRLLARIGVPAVVPLILALGSEHPNVRISAAKALGRIRDERAVQPLLNLMADPDMQVRRSASSALIKFGSMVVWQLHALFINGNVDVRISVIRALLWIGDTRTIELFISALKDDEAFVRKYAAYGLGRLQALTSIDSLIEATNDPEALVRKSVAHALGEIGDNRAITALAMLLEDKAVSYPDRYYLNDKAVNQVAADALRKIGTSQALNVLKEHGFELDNLG